MRQKSGRRFVILKINLAQVTQSEYGKYCIRYLQPCRGASRMSFMCEGHD